MRELKFRVWCKRTQEYHTLIDEEDYDADGKNYWLQMCIDTNGRLYFIETSDEDAGFEYVTHDCEIIDGEDAKNFIIEQCTGLRDKNGKEIYEGDIVKNIEGINETAFCVWDESNAEFDFRSKNGKYTKDNVKAWLEMYEVVGNIHENQDLLGGMNTTSKEEG